jgi:uncharacterized protein YdeI (YjbR/CyaY-like superfamily)
MAKLPTDSYPLLSFDDASSWSDWLQANHSSTPGVWLRLRKKAADGLGLTYLEALEEALCYGWIDGQAKSADEGSFVQKFTPRRAGSAWSKINRERAIRLTEAGRMKPSGFAEIEKAKANGRWDAAYSSAAPPEFEAAIAGNRKARKFYETLDSRNRMAIHYRIQMLRKPESRARKAAEFVVMLAEGRKLF